LLSASCQPAEHGFAARVEKLHPVTGLDRSARLIVLHLVDEDRRPRRPQGDVRGTSLPGLGQGVTAR
jgi:hypothetical protein